MAVVSVITASILQGEDGTPEKSSDLPEVTQLGTASQVQTPGIYAAPWKVRIPVMATDGEMCLPPSLPHRRRLFLGTEPTDG